MIKYFIENDKGEWLVPPGEHLGSCWTRDPYKAWTFDYRCSNNWEKHKQSGMYFLKELSKEIRLDPGIHISKHEFTQCWDKYSLRDSNGDLYLDINHTGNFKRLSNIQGPVISNQGFNYKVTV